MAFFTVATPAAWAQGVSSGRDPVSAGKSLALHICAACHVVSPDQRFRPTLLHPAPDFVAIARMPSATTGSLKLFIGSRHDDFADMKKMPDQSLLDDQLDNVVAYIMSLKPKAAPKPAAPANRPNVKS
jgi:mono/diheme cytochrome c family protein